MAEFTYTILQRPDESAISTTPSFTLVAVAFSRFLGSLPALVEAERDLGDYAGQDPAVDPWIRAAEAAREATLRKIDAVLATDAAHPGDARLHQVALLYRQVMLSDRAEEVSWLRYQASRRGAFLLPGTGGAAGRVNRFVIAALGHLEDYLTLDDGPAEDPELAIGCAEDYAELPAA